MQQTQLTTFQTKILIGIFLFLLLTPIRSIAIMVSPLFVYGIYCLHHFKMQRGTGWLFALWGGTSLIGILNYQLAKCIGISYYFLTHVIFVLY